MKQYITEEQWNEIKEEQQEKIFFDLVKKNEIAVLDTYWMGVNIGQMIEFLGDEWEEKVKEQGSDRAVGSPVGDGNVLVSNILMPSNKILCDKLWEAIKYELKQQL